MNQTQTSERYWQNWDNGEAARRINAYWESDEQGWRNQVAAELRKIFAPNTELLEVGCGSGLIYETLCQAGIVTRESYSGGDISEKMLEIARARDPQANFIKLDIFDIDFPYQSHTNVLNVHVLQHLPSYEVPVAELIRITRNQLMIICWFNDGITDELHFSEPSASWDNQSFQNNFYSLPKFLEYIRKTGGDRIKDISITHFDHKNKGILIKFKGIREAFDKTPVTGKISDAVHQTDPKITFKGYLQGKTVSLRLVQETDLDLLVQWRNDPENWVHFFNPNPLSKSKQRDWFATVQKTSDKQFFVILSEENTSIGTLSLDKIDRVHQNAEVGNVLVGDKHARGKGVAKEAIKLLIEYSFLTENLNRLYLTVFAGNEAAIRLYKSLGFRQEGVLKEAIFSRGKFCDVIIMGLVRSGSGV